MNQHIAVLKPNYRVGASSPSREQSDLRHFLRAGIMSLWFLILGINSQVLAASEPVNINSANAEVLAEALHGVGLTKAHRIVEYREAHGPFEQVDELAAVQGIGLETIERNRDVIRLQ